MIHFLVHDKQDSVGVATVDIKKGDKARGMYMDTQENIDMQAASGAVVHLFPTGQGNIVGHPIEPVIKLSANPLTCRTMSEHIDLDVSPVLQADMTLDQAGDKLLDLLVRTCNGRLTAAEILRHREFIMTKLYRSA